MVESIAQSGGRESVPKSQLSLMAHCPECGMEKLLWNNIARRRTACEGLGPFCLRGSPNCSGVAEAGMGMGHRGMDVHAKQIASIIVGNTLLWHLKKMPS